MDTPLAPSGPSKNATPVSPPRRKSRRWRWIAGFFLALLIALAVAARIIIGRAQPTIRTRVIETLSTRFKSKVDLATLNVSVLNGLEVSGGGLKIFGATDPNPYEPGVQPLLEIQEFRFHTGVRGLFRKPMHVDTVYVKGLTMNIPPKQDRSQVRSWGGGKNKISIAVDHFVCQDTKLVINTSKPGKAPLEFDVSNLVMKDIGPGQPLQFDATLVNPKPVGDIHSTGKFGPLNEISPGDSAVQGDYSFREADLGTLKGIAGILSSTGNYSGTLGKIEVQGQTDTPDFRLNISGHPVPLHTDFHAIVDGTDGDTYLDPVQARILHSSFTAKGKIVRVQNKGHDIELDVVLGRAEIQDLLQLGVKTTPPIMSGAVQMKTKLSIPPGAADVANRMKLDGNFHLPAALFSNEKVQTRIDSLSLRSQGKAKLAQQGGEPSVPSDIQGAFRLDNGVFSFSSLDFTVPGTRADVTGEYSLDGNTFDFHGTLRLEAKLSQMTTGWKSILLKPVDPFFNKKGAGTQVPFKITGTRSEPRFGLDFGRKDKDKDDKNEEGDKEKSKGQ